MFQRVGRQSRRPRAQDRPRPRPGPWLLLFGTALAMRVLCAWLAAGPGAAPPSEAREYESVAWNLARGAGFALDGTAGPRPTALVPPLVPWITSLVYRAFGHEYFAAVLLQCGIGALVPLLLASFGGAVFGGGIGRLAGWLAALHPLLVFFSGRLLPETAFSALLLVAFLASVAWVKNPRPGRALGVGLAWGVGALAQPAALLLPLVVAGWAWVPLGLSMPPRERARQLALLLLGLALAVGPWTLRNALVLHAFVPITTGGVLLDGNDTLARLARFWRLSAGHAAGSWPRPDSPLATPLRWFDPLLTWSLVTLPFAIWGAGRTLAGPRRWFQSLGLLTVLYFTALAVAFPGSLRARVPVEPLLALFAAVGFEDVRRRMRTRARGLRVVEGGH